MPAIGCVKKGSQLSPLADAVGALVIETADQDQFRHLLKAALEQNPTHIFIEGGDGTAQKVMSEYLQLLSSDQAPARFTLVAGGTTNQVARNIGVQKLNASHIEKILSRDVKSVNLLSMLEIIVDEDEKHHGFLFSTGAIPQATESYLKKVDETGKKSIGAVYTTIVEALGTGTQKENSFMAPSPMKLTVTMNKEQAIVEEDHLGTITTTLPGFILGIDPFWGKGEAPLRMTYVGGQQTRIIRLVVNAALKRFKTLKSTQGVESWNADHILMDYKGPIVLDGEKLTSAQSSLEIRATAPIEFVGL